MIFGVQLRVPHENLQYHIIVIYERFQEKIGPHYVEGSQTLGRLYAELLYKLQKESSELAAFLTPKVSRSKRTRLEKLQRSGVRVSERRHASLGIKEVQFRAPSKPLEHHNTMVLKGSRKALSRSPIMRIAACLSDIRCNYSQSFKRAASFVRLKRGFFSIVFEDKK